MESDLNKEIVDAPSKDNLNNSKPNIKNSNIDESQKRWETILVLRWLVCPTLYVIFAWYSVNHKETITSFLPASFFSSRMNKTISEHLTAVPDKLSEAWDVGILYYKYTELRKANPSSNTPQIKAILTQAATLLNRLTIEEDEFNQVYKAILEKEKEVSLYSKFKGFFNFVNLMWLGAIIGILCTIGPFIAIIISPLMESLTKIAIFIVNNIIIPCNRVGVFEVIAYFVCILFVSDGYRYNQEVGFYIALLGILGFIPCFFYSTFLFYPYPSQDSEKAIQFFSIVFTITFLPFTLFYQSHLLAWFLVILFYNCLGFSVLTYGLCYFIGFSRDELMFRCFLTSFYIQTIFITLKISGSSALYLDIFAEPFTILGSIVLFLALLIMSSKWFSFRRSDYYYINNQNYIQRQFLMIIFLVAYIYIGSVYGINGMKNTAITFLVLYISEKYVEIHYYLDAPIVVLGFFASVFAYVVSLYLYSHKEFVTSLFKY